jgi:hypothetical protein
MLQAFYQVITPVQSVFRYLQQIKLVTNTFFALSLIIFTPLYTLHYLKIVRSAETCRNGYEIFKIIKVYLLLVGYFSVVYMLPQRDVRRKETFVPLVKIEYRFSGCLTRSLLTVLT